MSWNHRVMLHKHEFPNGHVEETFQIHEVYYNEQGEVESWTQNPVAILGESLGDIQVDLDRIRECLAKPILNYCTGKEIFA